MANIVSDILLEALNDRLSLLESSENDLLRAEDAYYTAQEELNNLVNYVENLKDEIKELEEEIG